MYHRFTTLFTAAFIIRSIWPYNPAEPALKDCGLAVTASGSKGLDYPETVLTKLRNRDQLIFGLYYAALFSGVAIVLPHFPRWLEAEGLGAEQVGIVLTAAFVGKVFFGPLFSTFADMSGTRKVWLILLCSGYLLAVAALHFSAGFAVIFIVWAIGGSLLTTQIPLSDSMSVLAVKQRGLDYGSARLWGSISFILVSMATGYFFSLFGDVYILPALTLFAVVAVLATALLPNLKSRRGHRASLSLLTALGIADFRVFVVIAALVMASHATLYGFATIHWSAAGLNEFEIGLLWAVGVIVEVILFAYGTRLLRRLDISGLLTIAVVGGTLRWLALGMTTDLWWLVPIQALHACTFAATHLAVVGYIARSLPDHLGASAQGIYDVLANGVFFVVAMGLALLVFPDYQGRAFWAMALLTLTAGIILVCNRGRFNG